MMVNGDYLKEIGYASRKVGIRWMATSADTGAVLKW
jgi:hypothetical protein